MPKTRHSGQRFCRPPRQAAHERQLQRGVKQTRCPRRHPAAPPAVVAQGAAAQITAAVGVTILDASGAVLRGATVTVRGANRQKDGATAVSGDTGTCRVALIPPGVYEATVDLQGFAPQNRKNV